MAPVDPPSPSPWVRGPLWDLFWLHGGLWLAPLAVLTSAGWDDPSDSPAQLVYLALSALFWIGHRFSSTWLAWLTTAYGPARAAQPTRFWTVPLGVVALTFAVVLAPSGWLPGTWLERVVVLGAVDYFLVTYHFAAQHFGVLSLYRARSGPGVAPMVRGLDRGFALTVGGGLIIAAELLQGATTLPDAWLGPLAGVAPTDAVRVPLAVVTLALTGAQLVVARRHTPSLPRALYILGLGGMALSALVVHPFVYIFCWTAQHWLAAVGLASVVTRGEPAPPAHRTVAHTLHRVHRAPGRWVLLLALLSAVAMPLYEVEASGGPADRPAFAVVDQALGGLLSAPLSLQVLTAVGLSTAFLHYLLDRAVWRFSDPLVRAAAAPLLRPPVAAAGPPSP